MKKHGSGTHATGGIERAKRLSPEERSEIALAGAAARWNKGTLPAAVCGSPDRPLRIADVAINCYVLNDGRRVLSQRGLQAGIGMSEGGAKKPGAPRLVGFVAPLEAKGIHTKELAARLRDPILFTTPGGGRAAYGYEATILADICDAVLEARKRGVLQSQQEHIAKQCEILVRGFARVGIIALVDEATGYQDLRARDALAKILEAFVAKEIQKWVKTFPADFYKELFRLRGLPYTGKVKRPGYVGHLTNDLIYARLAPGVLAELRAKNPVVEKGRRLHKHHQWLTADIGHPKLKEHLMSVVVLMKASEGWEQFKGMVDRALPKHKELPLFNLAAAD